MPVVEISIGTCVNCSVTVVSAQIVWTYCCAHSHANAITATPSAKPTQLDSTMSFNCRTRVVCGAVSIPARASCTKLVYMQSAPKVSTTTLVHPASSRHQLASTGSAVLTLTVQLLGRTIVSQLGGAPGSRTEWVGHNWLQGPQEDAKWTVAGHSHGFCEDPRMGPCGDPKRIRIISPEKGWGIGPRGDSLGGRAASSLHPRCILARSFWHPQTILAASSGDPT